jgi:glycosyltransferase involved in cell wall biosynthesis
MRIALFSDTYLPTVNGVARTLGRLVAHADRAGHQVALVTTTVSPTPARGTVLHHQLPGIPLPMYPELQVAWPLGREGRRLLDAFRPDLVHAATESTVGWSGRAWALQNGVPLVTSFHTDFPAYLAGYGLGGLETPVWRALQTFHAGARITFCPSSATRDQLRRWGFQHDLRIWSRGVDTKLYDPGRRSGETRRAIAPGAERILLYVGRLAPEKRLDVLLDAFPRIREACGPAVALALVGDGPWREHLELRAPAGVRFLGYRTGASLAEAYAAADLFVFPSDTETFGNVVMEALASGLPVVAPAKGGVTDSVIPGRTGLLVPPREPAALADAVVTLLGDDLTRGRMARDARAMALERSWDLVLQRLLGDYREAIGGPTGLRPGGEGIEFASHAVTFPWPPRHRGVSPEARDFVREG